MDITAKKARVLLISPPTALVSNEVLLNLAYLAASLRKAGHEVKIIDGTAPCKRYTAEDIKKAAADFQPHFIGVTLTILYIADTYEYLKDLAKLKVPIVAGGPHTSCFPEEVLENGADISAIGEGEVTIVELAEYFTGRRPLESINGICYRDKDGKFSYTPRRALIQDLDSIPFPDFADFPIRNYTGSDDVNSNPIFWSVFTSRGCPFKCIYCTSYNVFGRTVRMRSPRNVFDEMKVLVEKLGVQRITFQDDEMFCSKKRVMELLDMIIDAKWNIKMSARTRIDSIDKELLLKAKEAGLTRITFGIESWNDDTLTKLNKKYNVETIHRKFKDLADADFPNVSFNNMIGFPWETKEDLAKSLREISKIPGSVRYFSHVVTLIPYPKTELYDRYYDRLGFKDWWLDADKHPAVIKNSDRPFFMVFAFGMHSLHRKNVFWNHSQEMSRAIEDFSWTIFKTVLKNRYKTYMYVVPIYLLCRLSYFTWKRAPRLERILFRPFFNGYTMKVRDNLVFTNKY